MMAGIFQSSRGGFTSVRGYRNARIGDYVCRFGDKTGRHCSTVIDTGRCAQGACGLTWTSGSTTDGGDSGGPVYSGTSAMGIDFGWLDEKEQWYDIATRKGELFTPIATVMSKTNTVLCYDEAPDPNCVVRNAS